MTVVQRKRLENKQPAKVPPVAYKRVGDVANNRVSSLQTLAGSKIPRDMTKKDVNKFINTHGKNVAKNMGLI